MNINGGEMEETRKLRPELPYPAWRETRETLHLCTQIVGKVRLALSFPINHWWHVPSYFTARGITTSTIPYLNGSFDLALTFFSGRCAPLRPGVNLITREVYSHEVISCGFWSGSDEFQKAAFYSYTAPSPPWLEAASLRPNTAFYSSELSEFILLYDDIRQAQSPEQALLDFFHSSYEAGAALAGWDREFLECHPSMYKGDRP